MDDQNSLLHPLISITTTISHPSSAATVSSSLSSLCHHNSAFNLSAKAFPSKNKIIIIRLLFVLSVAAISLWANHEASKSFEILLVNDARDIPAGRRFDLFYVSNDRATRILLNASSFVEHLLYPNNIPHQFHKKQIGHVTLRLASRNLNATVSAGNQYSRGGRKVNNYVIDLSPSLIQEANYNEAIERAVLLAMARVWLWDGEGRAPARLIDGVVEYVAEVAGYKRKGVSGAGEWSPECDGVWWKDEDPRTVPRFLHYCEAHKEGIIRRLNQAMRDTWHDRMLDDVLEMPAKKLCAFYNASWAA